MLTHISDEILLLKVLAGSLEVFSFFEKLFFKILQSKFLSLHFFLHD